MVRVPYCGVEFWLERATRIELASSAWKAGVLAIELRPQVWSGYREIGLTTGRMVSQ